MDEGPLLRREQESIGLIERLLEAPGPAVAVLSRTGRPDTVG